MARTQVVTILFCDLVASTERRARLGDDVFDEFTGRFMAGLRDAISQNDGREVSSAGDGLMVVFPDSVVDAVTCAVAMHRTVALLDPHDPPRLRIGISSGEVARDGDEFSGMPIVEAARLEASAAPGQTLANAVVRTLVGTRRALRFRDVGSLTLKGIPEPLATVEVIDEQVLESPQPPFRAQTPNHRRRRWRFVAPVVAAIVVAAIAVVVMISLVASRSRSEARNPTVTTIPLTGITAPTGYTPRYETASCPGDVRQAAAGATCGHLVIPQDRRKPHGKQVTLLVTRAPARLPGRATDPTIDVCGCENLGNSLARDHSELVHLGQRGYDGTPALTCPEFVAARLHALTRRSDDPAEIARGTDAFRRCHARLVAQGIDPAQYNYDTAAQDVLDLMWALKISRANFIAFEPSSVEVFDIVRRAPGAVRSITLDNPPPPGQTLLSDPTGDLSGAFARFVAVCNADPTCARAYPHLAEELRSSSESSNRNPVLVSAPNPENPNAPPMKVMLDGRRQADALAAALRDASTYRAIPTAINQPTSASIEAALALQEDHLVPDAPWGAQASYFCAYDVHTQDPQVQTLEAHTLPEFVRAHDAYWTQWCTAWNVADVSADLSTDVVSNVPTLVLRGNLTPDGNPDWIPKIGRGLSALQAVVFPTLGSDLLANGPPCLSALRRQFLANPTATLDTAGCEKQSPPIPFIAPTH